MPVLEAPVRVQPGVHPSAVGVVATTSAVEPRAPLRSFMHLVHERVLDLPTHLETTDAIAPKSAHRVHDVGDLAFDHEDRRLVPRGTEWTQDGEHVRKPSICRTEVALRSLPVHIVD